jgi:hypothetical protein
MHTPTLNRKRWAAYIVEFLCWGFLFGVCYVQSPLYTSNQNQYFLHGFANAGFGFLQNDWLANTTDSTPVFSLLSQLTYNYLDVRFFYLYYFVLFGIYLYSIVGIASLLYDIRRSKTKHLLFLTLIFFIHSAALRSYLSYAVSERWEYLLDAGVAGQRLLGTVLQPSCFGVFFLLSIEQFLRGKPLRAIIASTIATTVHPTYLLSSAVITVSYVLVTYYETRQIRRAFFIAVLALILILPILSYVYISFVPIPPDAQDILVNFRIPHHAVPTEWIDETVALKLLIVIVALFMIRGTKIFPIMFITTAITIASTLMQMLLDHNGLALLLPWRLSAYLVPLATVIIAANLVSKIVARSDSWISKHPTSLPVACLFVIGALIFVGASRFALQVVEKRNAPEQGMLAFVQQNLAPEQLYLIPHKLQNFRLATGAPILVDFKSIPYTGSEVREWYRRVRIAQWFYRDTVEGIDCGILDQVSNEYNVTHVVLGRNQLGLTCDVLETLYNDNMYGVFGLEAKQ